MKTFKQFVNEVYAGQPITDREPTGVKSGSIGATTKPKQPSLLDKIRGKANAKKATNNTAKQAGQSVKNATDNTAGTGSQRKPQPYRQANKTASPKPEKGGALAKSGDKKEPIAKTKSSPIQKAKVSVQQPNRPMLGTAQRPDLTGAKPQPQLSPSPQQKRLPGATRALPPAKS